jgi:hypothetical protein
MTPVPNACASTRELVQLRLRLVARLALVAHIAAPPSAARRPGPSSAAGDGGPARSASVRDDGRLAEQLGRFSERLADLLADRLPDLVQPFALDPAHVDEGEQLGSPCSSRLASACTTASGATVRQTQASVPARRGPSACRRRADSLRVADSCFSGMRIRSCASASVDGSRCSAR